MGKDSEYIIVRPQECNWRKDLKTKVCTHPSLKGSWIPCTHIICPEKLRWVKNEEENKEEQPKKNSGRKMINYAGSH